MNEIFVTNQKIYAINGLSHDVMELLSDILHDTIGDLEQPKLDLASDLVQAVDSQLQAK
jgi:hypothetical protein